MDSSSVVIRNRSAGGDVAVAARSPGGTGVSTGVNLVLSVERHVGPLLDEWEALADRSAPAPFVRPGWITAWSQAFGAGSLEVLCAREAGRLVGVLPVRRRPRAVDSPTNFHTPEFGLLADHDDARRVLADGVFALRPRRVAVGFLDADRADAAALEMTARARGYQVEVRSAMRSPYVVIDSDWTTYEQRLSRNLLGDLRRCRRRLEERGGLTITISDGRDGLDELLEQLFSVDAHSWQAAARTAIVSHKNTQQFYEEVCRWAASRGSLRVSLLRVAGRSVAMELGLEEAGVHFAMKSSYDQSYRRFSPGKILLHGVIESAFIGRLKRVELLGAEDRYKRLWASHSRERLNLQAYANSPVGWLEWAADIHGRKLARRAGLDRVRHNFPRLG
ncbi:MAG: GNAT family N-acetyltransferase [Solirubrobacteraceae bacterium]